MDWVECKVEKGKESVFKGYGKLPLWKGIFWRLLPFKALSSLVSSHSKLHVAGFEVQLAGVWF